MHPRTMPALLATLALSAALLAGCTAQAEASSAAIYVKDSPSDEVTHLDVTFGQVAVHKAPAHRGDGEDDGHDDVDEHGRDGGGHDGNASSNGTGHVAVSVTVEDEREHAEKAGWVILSNQTATVDLKALSGNDSAFLAGADVPAGRYDQVRLTILSAKATLANGTVVNVTVPSGVLRLQAHFTVSAGNETALTLDFDLDYALHKTGDGRYVLSPVLRMDGEHRPHPHRHDWERREQARDQWSERRDHDGHGDDVDQG